MTSGNFQSIPVSQIIVNRDERQRREIKPDYITELAASIAKRGLINPIVVTRELELVAGECRLSAIRTLGWLTVNVQFAEDLSRTELALIELEENTKRRDLDWKDQCEAVAKYHHMQKELDPTWTSEATATALGFADSHIAHLLSIQEEITAGNTLVINADKFSVARNLTHRKAVREKEALVNSILEPELAQPTAPLLYTTVQDWLPAYTGPKFNFIHCDFPYGINFHTQKGMSSANKERYDDTFATYKHLLEEVLPALPTSEAAHLMFWFSPIHFEYTKLKLIQQGWVINPFPIIWAKSDNSGLLPDPQRGGRRTYETAFIGSKGDRLLVQPVAMHWHGARGEATHASVKPREMLRHFFRMFVDGTSRVLDPTCGSGNALRVAKDMGAAHVLGLEANADYHADAVRMWEE